MDAYCNRNGYPITSVRFIYEGESIKDSDTPESLKMEDNDEIDAMIEQHGGFGFYFQILNLKKKKNEKKEYKSKKKIKF